MRVLVILCFCLMSGPVQAASIPTGLDAFFRSLNQTEKGKMKRITRISWWGDSAVASDGYTGVLRRLLQKKFGDGGPGYLLIDPTYKGYYHQRVRMKRHGWKSSSLSTTRNRNRKMGLAGSISRSYGGAGTTFFSKGGTFHRAIAFFGTGKAHGDLQLFVQEQGRAHARHSTRRDSFGSDTWSQALPAGTQSVKLRAAGQGPVRVFGLALETEGPGLVLDTLGLVGLRARGLSRLEPTHFERQLKLRKPDLMVLHFGGNERVDPQLSAVRHASEVDAVVQRLRKARPQASCLLIGPIPHGRWVNRRLVDDDRLLTIVKAQQEVATKRGCAFFDAIEAFGGKGSARLMREKKWLVRDLAHMSAAGQREVAARIHRWLMKGYASWKEAEAKRATRVPHWE